MMMMLMLSLPVKEFSKSINIWCSWAYCFWTTLYTARLRHRDT